MTHYGGEPQQPTPRRIGRCPVGHATTDHGDRRKSGRGEDDGAPAVEQRGDVWHLRSYDAVRQVLRDADGVRQAAAAALDAEAVIRSDLRQPVIFQDGAPHREQRTAIARFFTPRAVDETYQTVIEHLCDEAIADLRQGGRAELSAMSMRLAVQVAARVVGLTDSARPRMDLRIASLLFFDDRRSSSPFRRAVSSLLSKVHALRFFLLDVRPAITARRRDPRDDVISHLLTKNYRPVEILIECMTYAVAGMVTTREFIGMAAWHLLEDDALRRAYLGADKSERHRILHEILRLEPVAGHLYRRATKDLEIQSHGGIHHIPAGALLDLHIRAANTDPDAVGGAPLELHPERDLGRGVQPPVLSFGDGAHRCPGAFLAIQESDVFLHRLLRVPVRMQSAPHLTWNETLNSYELRDFEIEVQATVEHPHGDGARD